MNRQVVRLLGVWLSFMEQLPKRFEHLVFTRMYVKLLEALDSDLVHRPGHRLNDVEAVDDDLRVGE